MPFLYYAAAKPAPLPDCLAHLRGLPLHVRGVSRGPSGRGEGVVFAAQQALELGHVALRDELRFRPVAGSDGAVLVAQVLTPAPLEKLEREPKVEGPQLLLDDGRRWQVPRVRLYADAGEQVTWTTAIPCRLDLDDQERLTQGEPLPRFASAWAVADAWSRLRFGALAEDELSYWDLRGWLAAAAVVLGVNYAVGLRELMLCGALASRQAAERVLDAAVDYDGLVELQKKRRARCATASPSPGPGEDFQATDPPVPT